MAASLEERIAKAEVRLSDAYESDNAERIQKAESRLSDLMEQQEAEDA